MLTGQSDTAQNTATFEPTEELTTWAVKKACVEKWLMHTVTVT